ncbi:MAG TPA: MFS transporter [Candidatus Limnocylindrales bacterium]
MPEPAQPARRRDRLRRLIVDVEPLRRDRDFRYLWMGQVVSGLGRQVTSIVLPYQLYVLTGTPLAIGALALVQVVPIMAFSLGGGVVADAVDRRRLLLLTQAGLAISSAALAGLAMMAAPPVLAIYAVAFVAAGLGAMDQPARSSAVPRLVPRERLPAALALGQLNFQAAGVVGPAIGGLVIASLGIAAGYAFDVITFGAAIGALLLIAPIPPAHGAVRPSLGAIAEGLRFARRRRAILGTFAVDLNAMVFGMPTALFPVLALDVFRVGPAGLGLLAAAPAAGALVGAVLTGWVGRVRRTGRAVLWASAGWGLAITAFGLCTFSFPLALVFLAAAGAADVVTAVLRSAIVQLLTPDELRGRVTSIHILVVTGGPRLGDVEASAVASLAGAQLSVVSGGLLCLVGLVAIVRSFPELAAFDMWEVTALAATEPEPGPAPAA